MPNISIRELRANTKEVLDMMNRGQDVVITSHGKPIARLVPHEEPKDTAEQSEAFGMWSDHEEMNDVQQYVKKLRKGRKL